MSAGAGEKVLRFGESVQKAPRMYRKLTHTVCELLGENSEKSVFGFIKAVTELAGSDVWASGTAIARAMLELDYAD